MIDASPKLVYLDTDGNPTTNPKNQLRPEIRLEGALRSYAQRHDRGGDARAAATELEAFAQENGLVLDPEAFSGTVINGRKFLADGSEHSVYVDKATRRVIKITHGDHVGTGVVGQSSSVAGYLNGLQNANLLFCDGIRLEGIVSLDGQFPQVVISQPFVKGREATPEEIKRFFNARGFRFVDFAWRKGATTVSDAVPKNVMAFDEKDGSVTVIPFDLQVVGDIAQEDNWLRMQNDEP